MFPTQLSLELFILFDNCRMVVHTSTPISCGATIQFCSYVYLLIDKFCILFFLMCSVIFQKGPLAVAYISIYTVHSDFVFLLPPAMHVHTWPQMSCKQWEFLFWVKFDNFRGILMYHLHVKSLTPYVTVHHQQIS